MRLIYTMPFHIPPLKVYFLYYKLQKTGMQKIVIVCILSHHLFFLIFFQDIHMAILHTGNNFPDPQSIITLWTVFSTFHHILTRSAHIQTFVWCGHMFLIDFQVSIIHCSGLDDPARPAFSSQEELPLHVSSHLKCGTADTFVKNWHVSPLQEYGSRLSTMASDSCKLLVAWEVWSARCKDQKSHHFILKAVYLYRGRLEHKVCF